MNKNNIKYVLILLAMFSSIIIDDNLISLILFIPLIAFCMFSGIKYFIYCIFTCLTCGTLFYIFNSENFFDTYIYYLIALALFFIFYFLFIFLKVKLIYVYFNSCVLSLILTYTFNILINVLLTLIITFIFSFLVKNFSLCLNSFSDDSSKSMLIILLTIYIANISKFLNDPISDVISLLIIMICLSLYAKNNKITYVLSSLFAIYIMSFLLNYTLISENVFLLFISTFLICFSPVKKNYILSLLIVLSYIINYFTYNNITFLYYLIMAIINSLAIFISKHRKSEVLVDRNVVNIEFQNSKISSMLDNFSLLFDKLSTNFSKARQNRILYQAKCEVFDTLCANCEKYSMCEQNGKHLLINYIKEAMLNNLDDFKINYIKENCIKQKAYFKLLDKFTREYLIIQYQNNIDCKEKNFLADDFMCFSTIFSKMKKTIIENRLYLSTHFYDNLKSELIDYGYDVVFVNNYSDSDTYMFDIAINCISRDEICNVLLPIIEQLLNCKVKITSLNNSTVSFSYFIISIVEIEKIKIRYDFKQSNVDYRFNGDSCRAIDLTDRFYFVLSDGMGSGMDANEESYFTVDTISSILNSGIDVNESLLLTNELIKLKNSYESYTTVDLLCIDKQTMQATFYKYGAFTTYIIREHVVIDIENMALPLGICNFINISPFKYQLKKGDVILMCSDGMIDDNNTDILSILENVSIDSPVTICSTLFEQLISIRQNVDDATLIIITIK